MKENYQPAYWAIVPAAGIGQRFAADIPKQYLQIHNKAIIEYSIEALLKVNTIKNIIVSLNVNDQYWHALEISKHPKIVTVQGGDERCNSVMNGLQYLASLADKNDWVIVHDAVRPCIKVTDIELLMECLNTHDVGGLLGASMVDTLKIVQDKLVTATADRDRFWQAYTPQMFRYEVLYKAISMAISRELPITDESSAVEAMGMQPVMIPACRSNIKITKPVDLAVAELYLQQEK